MKKDSWKRFVWTSDDNLILKKHIPSEEEKGRGRKMMDEFEQGIISDSLPIPKKKTIHH